MKKVEIISEVAQGYEGNIKLAKLLTKGAVNSGADSIKFQLVYADELATPEYQYYSLFKSLEMDLGVWREIAEVIHDNNKRIYFDIFGQKSLANAKKLNADGVKLSTTEFYNKELIIKCINNFEKVYISVGGIPKEDIDKLVHDTLINYSYKICLMYGFQAEPTPLEYNNLLRLRTLKKHYPEFEIGFMDHSIGSSEDRFCLALVALGVGISSIEKHITLDRLLKIEDYISGLNCDDFEKFVNNIRKFEYALGSNSFDLSELEVEYRNKSVKSVVTLTDLNAGDRLSYDNVALKRAVFPKGVEPYRVLGDVLTCKLKINKLKDQTINKEDI